jgi:predicted nucleic acid-binding protein
MLPTLPLWTAAAPGHHPFDVTKRWFIEAAISVASITELHFGVLIADDSDERARRADRLAAVEATFDPLPVTVEVARAWGRLAAAVAQRGDKPRRRQIDLAIAATATVEQVPLLTHNVADFHVIADLVEVRQP